MPGTKHSAVWCRPVANFDVKVRFRRGPLTLICRDTFGFGCVRLAISVCRVSIFLHAIRGISNKDSFVLFGIVEAIVFH